MEIVTQTLAHMMGHPGHASGLPTYFFLMPLGTKRFFVNHFFV